MQKIGIFGGTFDPIHIGHIAMAIALKEAHHLDHIFFVPARANPHKHKGPSTAPQHRIHMLRLALRQVPDCSILTLELKRTSPSPSPSYMIDTVLTLKSQKKFSNSQFFLLLGQDLLPQFSEWKSPHELIKLAPPLIAMRGAVPPAGTWQKDPALKKALIQGMTDTPLFDVSATEIRQRITRGLYCGHLLHQAVYRYIIKHKLYDHS